MTTKQWLIVGAGYTGGALAQRLVERGDAVVATRRPKAEVPGTGTETGTGTGTIAWLPLDLDAPLPELPAAELVVLCAPPGTPAGEREAKLVVALRGCRHVLYVSSTGVYGPGGGQWIDETHPLRPESDTEKARVAAEEAVRTSCQARGLRWTSLRAAGIYGPGRGLVERLRRGEARVFGDGSAHISRIHVFDLVSAIIAAADKQIDGPVNCGDDNPAPFGHVLDDAAALLGLPPPPRVDPATLSPTMRGLVMGNRRVANRRLREELGVDLRYPSWRTAAEEQLAAERGP